MDFVNFIIELFNTILLVVIGIFTYFYNLIFPNRKSVKNQIALITGSGSGIGRGIALKLSELGCTLVLVDVNQRTNNETGKMIRDQGGDCILYTCDLSDRADISKFVERVKKEVGEIEILVNNAGIVSGQFLDEISEDQIQKSFDINIMAQIWLTKHFLPGMKHLNRGHIINIASVAGLCGANKMTDYSASKHAVVGFTECLKEELRAGNFAGVKTTCVCPYFIDTGMFKGYTSKFSFILKGLKPTDVVNEIMDAMLKDQEMLIIPWRLNLALAVKYMLPGKSFEALGDFMGFNECMNNFVGRKK